MLARNILSVLPATAFFLAYSAAAQTSPTDLFTKVAEQSRHLADTGQWDEAKAVLEEQLSKKDAVQVARFKAELAHLAADRNTYFHKDEAPVLAALQEARSAVQADQDKPALAILEMAEGRFTYWKALDQTKDWGPPTEDFDRALQTYKELGDELGLGEAMFYRGLVYQMQEQNQRARQIFEQALPLAQQGNSPRALYSAQLTLAKWYLDEDKTAEAKKLAEQSRSGAEAFGDSKRRKEAEDFLKEHR